MQALGLSPARRFARASAILTALAACALAAPARADVIQPFSGECPPGLGRAVRNRTELCMPRPCLGPRDCGEGASCRNVLECVGQVEHTSGDSVVRTDAVLGPCGEGGHCAEGTCRPRGQCEPDAPTPAWDATTRAWTGVSHPTPPTPAPSAGCCSGHRAPATSVSALVGLGLIALAVRRRHASEYRRSQRAAARGARSPRAR